MRQNVIITQKNDLTVEYVSRVLSRTKQIFSLLLVLLVYCSTNNCDILLQTFNNKIV